MENKSRIEITKDKTRKFYVTEYEEEREVTEKEYTEFNKSDKEREEENLKKKVREQMMRLREELQDDLKGFINDVNRIGVSMRDTVGAKTALIDSNSLTNFLLWKMLKGRI